MSKEKCYFGIPVDEFPEPCRDCEYLAREAVQHSGVDFHHMESFPRPSNEANVLARHVLSSVSACSHDVCGLSGKSKSTA